MPYPPQVFSLTGHAFGLTVSGVQVIDYVPTDLSPLRWEMPSEATTGGASFTILDTGQLALPSGAIVRLTDNVTNTLLFSGVLVGRSYAHQAGPVRRVECQAAGWGWFLDHRIVTAYTWGANTLGSDDVQVKELLLEFGGPIVPQVVTSPVSLTIPEAGTTARTTLRGAVGSLTGAMDVAGNPFHLYVDDDAVARWWWGSGGDPVLGTTPYRIGDGSYVSAVLATAGLTDYWPMDDAWLGTSTGGHAGTTMTWTGASSPAVDLHTRTIGVINEPGYRSVLFDGTTTVGTVAAGALTGAVDWSIECWFRHPTATATHTIYSGTAASSPLIRMLSTGKLDVSLRGGASEVASVTAWDDDAWHHLVVSHDAVVGGRIIVDGADDTGAMTARTFSASSGCTIGADVASNYWAGYLQHLAIYSTALGSGVTGGSVLLLFGGGGAIETWTALAHYEQGITFTPESLTYEVGSDDRANIVAAYDSGSTFVQWAWVGGWSSTYAVSPWDAGDPTTYHVDSVGVSNPEATAQSSAWALHGDITSVSFTATDYGGWRPHQAIIIDDSLLTGGVAETHYVAAVSGQIDGRDCIEWRVTTGAVARSIVQTISATT